MGFHRKSRCVVNFFIKPLYFSKRNKGCCFVDPLGDAIEDLLGKVPPERIKDVILFDPSDIEFPVGLNLLEFKTQDQKDFLIQKLILYLRAPDNEEDSLVTELVGRKRNATHNR